MRGTSATAERVCSVSTKDEVKLASYFGRVDKVWVEDRSGCDDCLDCDAYLHFAFDNGCQQYWVDGILFLCRSGRFDESIRF